MQAKTNKPNMSAMNYLLPIPDETGIDKLQKMHLNRIGKEISDEQAAEILRRVMLFIYLLSELSPQSSKPKDTSCDTRYMLENPRKTKAAP